MITLFIVLLYVASAACLWAGLKQEGLTSEVLLSASGGLSGVASVVLLFTLI